MFCRYVCEHACNDGCISVAAQVTKLTHVSGLHTGLLRTMHLQYTRSANPGLIKIVVKTSQYTAYGNVCSKQWQTSESNKDEGYISACLYWNTTTKSNWRCPLRSTILVGAPLIGNAHVFVFCVVMYLVQPAACERSHLAGTPHPHQPAKQIQVCSTQRRIGLKVVGTLQ